MTNKDDLEKVFERNSKEAFKMTYSPTEDITGLDSFTSSKFIAPQGENKDEYPLFVAQIKDPTKDLWYRLWIKNEEDFMKNSTDGTSSNGELFYIEEYKSKPEVSFEDSNPQESHFYSRGILNTKIEFKEIKTTKHIEDLTEELKEFEDHFEDYLEIINIHDEYKERGNLDFTLSDIWTGYPQWEQTSRIPKGVDINNFLFTISSDGHFGLSAVKIHVFKKDDGFMFTDEMS